MFKIDTVKNWHVDRAYSILNPCYVGENVSCLPHPTQALHMNNIYACIFQHVFAKLGGNLAMRQQEVGQYIANIDLV